MFEEGKEKSFDWKSFFNEKKEKLSSICWWFFVNHVGGFSDGILCTAMGIKISSKYFL